MESNIILNIKDSIITKERIKFERDPVCGEMIVPDNAKGMSVYKNANYYFCCITCKKVFDNNPCAYADKEEGHHNLIIRMIS